MNGTSKMRKMLPQQKTKEIKEKGEGNLS